MKLNTTYKYNTFYTSFKDLPCDIQEILKQTTPELENSHYTVYEDQGFIRSSVIIEGKTYNAEISLGSCDIRHSDYNYDNNLDAYVDDDKNIIDRDAYAECFLDELHACTDLDCLDVYLTLIE
jgi:hypothetical protein